MPTPLLQEQTELRLPPILTPEDLLRIADRGMPHQAEAHPHLITEVRHQTLTVQLRQVEVPIRLPHGAGVLHHPSVRLAEALEVAAEPQDLQEEVQEEGINSLFFLPFLFLSR